MKNSVFGLCVTALCAVTFIFNMITLSTTPQEGWWWMRLVLTVITFIMGVYAPMVFKEDEEEKKEE